MNNVQYHSVSPQNDNQEGFTQFSQITFELSGDGRLLKPNSVCLDADIVVESTSGTHLIHNDVITMDRYNGFHNYFSGITTEYSGGQLEHIEEYPRWYKSVAVATADEQSYNSSMANAEGRDGLQNASNPRLQLQGAKATDANNASFQASRFKATNFSIKPLIALNRTITASGGGYSFSDNGNIRITFNLERNGKALFGQGLTATGLYTLKNVKLRYMTTPDMGKDKRPKLMMESVVNVKQTAQSQQTSVDARVSSPAVKGVVINFLRQDRESDLKSNNNRLEQFPLLDKLNFRINDNQSNFISYDLESRAEMVSNGLKALSDAGFHKVHSRGVWSGESYIVGASFDQYMSLINNKLTVDFHSSSPNMSVVGQGYNIYMYFLTMISL